MLVKDVDEAIIVGRLNEVHHFMDDHILQQVLGLLYELRIEPDVSSFMIAGRGVPLGSSSGKMTLGRSGPQGTFSCAMRRQSPRAVFCQLNVILSRLTHSFGMTPTSECL